MSSRVQLKSTKLQHRKRPRKRKKSEIYRTPVLYHPGQRDYFNLQREYTCLPDEEILNLLSKNKLSLLIKAIKNKDNEEINRILYKDVNNIYLDKNYIYYDESNIKKQDSTYNEDTITKNENKNSYIHNINNNNYKNNNGKNHFLNDNELLNVLEEGGDKENKFIDINNIYFYFKKVNITNINKDNINTDIYKELLQLKKTSLEKEDAIGYNIYKYFLNIITNVDRSKYIDDFFLVNYINNIWITKNVHKYFYFLNSLFDRMKKISYKLFHLNYKIDVIGHEEEKNKMKYFERHELFDKVIKKTKFIPNYIIKHNYIYSNNILNLYEYDINTNSYINKFDETYKEVSLNDFLDINKKKKLNIFYDNKRFEPFYKYAQNYSKDNNLKKIMNITYSKEKYINSVSVLNKNNKEGNDINKNMYNKNDTSDDLKNHFEESLSSENSNQNHSNNYVENEENNKKDNNNSNDLLDKIKNNPELKNEILRKICEKMHSEFCEMKVLDEQGKIDLNKIDDIKNDKDNVLYKKVYAMRDFFYNIYYNNYKPNLDLYELETFVDAEYRTFSFKKDLNTLFINWVLNENKELPKVHFAKKDVEIAKERFLSKRKRKILEFNKMFLKRHGQGEKNNKRKEEYNENENENGNKTNKKSINCLIKWNFECEDKFQEINDDDKITKEDNKKEDTDINDFNYNKKDFNNDEKDSYSFCDENLDDFDDAESSFDNLSFAKLVIYDDNYDKEEFVETLMQYISTCDYKRAHSIYNLLKIKGKVDSLYFKNFERAENLAFLLRQSKQKILVDVELL